jgi:protocatechuate 3,4-dioxygenase beta subunit
MMNTRRLTNTLAFVALLFAAFMHATAQTTPATQTAPTDSKDLSMVSGRVMNGGKPAPDISVVLVPADWAVWSPQMKTIARATTDEAGRYKLSNLPPGKYQVATIAPGYVFAEALAESWLFGKLINLAAGEELKDIDFTLVRGGVVTGRITDSDGKPVIEGSVSLIAADPRERKEGKPRPVYFTTDDRGIYRAWGVAPGRYIVYAGHGKEDMFQNRGGDEEGFYPQTYYPSVTDEAQAKPIEVTTGSETEDIDITLGKLVRTYKASGRVTDEDGRPVVGAQMVVGTISQDTHRFTGSMFGGAKTDERGEFRMGGLKPGDWGIWATMGELFSEKQGTTYSDPATFSISDSDVSGLEIKMRRGASVSGFVTIEGTNDPTVLAKLSELMIGVWINTGPTGSASRAYVPARSCSTLSGRARRASRCSTCAATEWNSPTDSRLTRATA